MCGGFSNTTKASEWKKRFHITEMEEIPEVRYNARPSQNLPIIISKEPHKLIMAKWGFKPDWFKKKAGFINIRSESLTDKLIFKKAFMERRCIIPADGFYEWKKTPRGKQPYRIVLKSGEPFAMAGLWEETKEDGKKIVTFAIITIPSNKIMEPIHYRMPLVLRQEDEEKWLDFNESHPEKLIRQYDSRLMGAYEVSKLVNSPSNDMPEVIKQLH